MSDVRQSAVVPEDLRSRVRAAAEPIARSFGRVGLTPNHLTLIGFAIAIVAAAAAGLQAWALAGLLVIIGGAFDLLDGALARATNRVSAFGAFMDSVFDRWGETVVYLGILWGALEVGLSRSIVLAGAAMGAAFMVSYTRAKSEGLGFSPGRGMASVGLAPREVRIAILGIGLIVAGILPGVPDDVDVPGGRAYPLQAIALEITLALIALLATITVIQRILHVRKQAAEDRA